MSYKFDLITPIAKADFSTVGTGMTLTDTINGINIVKASNGGTSNVSGIYKSAPSTPYTITAGIQWNGDAQNYVEVGLGWSDGTKYTINQFGTNNVPGDGTAGDNNMAF